MFYLPSVTEVISPWVKFDGVRADVLQAAADRGTAVHKSCELYAKGVPVYPEDNIKGYVNSFKIWFDAVVDKVILVEERLIDDNLWFCGQIDLLVESKQKEILLVDLKTPMLLSKSWEIQLASYEQLCKTNGYKPDRVGSLRLNPDGKTPKMDWIPEKSLIQYNVFLSALNVFRYLNKK